MPLTVLGGATQRLNNTGTGPLGCQTNGPPAVRQSGARRIGRAIGAVVELTASTTGSSTEAATLIAIRPLGGTGTIPTTGSTTETAALIAKRILALVTTGSATDAVTLIGKRLLAAATTGQSNLAVVIVDVESLTASTQGSSSQSVQVIGVRVISAATLGVSLASATLVAIRAISAAMAGESDMAVVFTGNTIGAATSGSSDLEIASLDGATFAPPDVVTGGFTAFGTWDTSREKEFDRHVQIAVCTSGQSTMDIALSRVRQLTAATASRSRIALSLSRDIAPDLAIAMLLASLEKEEALV